MKFAPLNLRDLWLADVNPLRGLTMSRVIAELEAGQRGDFAMLQWLYHHIEKRDATLRGAKRRIRSALLKLDWNIKIRDGLDEDRQRQAVVQQKLLRSSYERLKNFRHALAHLALAEFRGFSHLERHYDRAGNVVRLQPVPQWHFCRDGIYGEWKFQGDALRGGMGGEKIDARDFIIRETEDPINEIALICFVRKNLGKKDRDAFVARYGIPFVFWILSDAMATSIASEPEKMAEWMTLMRGIGSDGEGIIPGGTLETLQSEGKGGEPVFGPYLKSLDEEIVMAATSGKLTMLNDATGLGGGNSETHADTFDEIALALAMDVSETLQEQFDAPLLESAFPDQEHFVYFELAAKDEADVGATVKHAGDLATAGYDMDETELSEKTGYKITRRAATESIAPETPNHSGFSQNRSASPQGWPVYEIRRASWKPPSDSEPLKTLSPDFAEFLDHIQTLKGADLGQALAAMETEWPEFSNKVMSRIDAGESIAAILADSLSHAP